MKKILLYSTDLILNYSFLIYLKNKYDVTTTSNIDEFKTIFNSVRFDIVMLDAEPSSSIMIICNDIHRIKENIPIVLTYVFNNRIVEFDKEIRKYVSSIFYKPFDVNEIANRLNSLC